MYIKTTFRQDVILQSKAHTSSNTILISFTPALRLNVDYSCRPIFDPDDPNIGWEIVNHAERHHAGGPDAITPEDIGAHPKGGSRDLDMQARSVNTDHIVSSNYNPDAIVPCGYELDVDPVTGHSRLTVNTLRVTKEAIFKLLTIAKTRAVNAREISSYANSVISRVVELSDRWRCYYEVKAKIISSIWMVGDQALMETFEPDKSRQKYYWALVVGEGVEDNECYVELSKSVKDGSGIPALNDEIIGLGHRGSDRRRTGAVIIESWSDEGPRILVYDDITSFSLENKHTIKLGKDTVISAKTIRLIANDGTTTHIARERGAWEANKVPYYHYDRVTYQGGLYLCITQNAQGISTPPSADDHVNWLVQSEAVELGVGNILVASDWRDLNKWIVQPTIIGVYDDTSIYGSKYLFTQNTSASDWRTIRQVFPCRKNTTYVIKFAINVFAGSNMTQLSITGSSVLLTHDYVATDTWVNVELTFNSGNNESLTLNFYTTGASVPNRGYVGITPIFLSEGNKAPASWEQSNQDIKDEIDNINIGGVNYFANSMLEVGGIDAGGGTDVSNASRFRSKGFIEFESAQATIGQFSQHDILIVCYDINKQYITSTFSQAGGWPAKYPFTVKVPIGTKYIRFSCKRSDGATVTQVDLTESKFMVEKGNKPSDYLLSIEDIPTTPEKIISAINVAPGQVTIQAEKIALLTKMLEFGKFSVDDDGNATMVGLRAIDAIIDNTMARNVMKCGVMTVNNTAANSSVDQAVNYRYLADTQSGQLYTNFGIEKPPNVAVSETRIDVTYALELPYKADVYFMLDMVVPKGWSVKVIPYVAKSNGAHMKEPIVYGALTHTDTSQARRYCLRGFPASYVENGQKLSTCIGFQYTFSTPASPSALSYSFAPKFKTDYSEFPQINSSRAMYKSSNEVIVDDRGTRVQYGGAAIVVKDNYIILDCFNQYNGEIEMRIGDVSLVLNRTRLLKLKQLLG